MDTLKIEETKIPEARSFVRVGDMILPVDAIESVRVHGSTAYVKLVGKDEDINCGGGVRKNKFTYQYQKEGETKAAKAKRDINNAKYAADEKRVADETLTALIKQMNARSK